MEGTDSTLSQDVSVWYRATVNAIAVDESGQYACLGGKKALYIVDLDDPWEAVKTLHQQSKFEVGTVQFNPHPSHHSYIASTANTNTLIWNLDDRRFALQVTFRSHERPVLDLGWSYGDANLLATCSADMNVVLWDTRSPKSALKLTTITPRAAVHLLKWNRKQTNLMATASNGEIRIWDIRKEKSALTHITAHMGKINAIDWSYNSENELLTAGQDATVKCWDTANPRKEKATIQAGLPVALASYTPFGGGVVTVAQRDDFCPRLWSLADTSAPIHSFSGENAHADIVTAVEWRTSTKHGEKKYQLVSWSKDQHLKFWKIDQPIFDCLSGRGPSEGDLFTMPGTPVNSLGVPSPRGHRSSPRDEQRVGLTQEFALMRQNPIRGITIKTLDAAQAYCEATARVGSYMQELKITFPSAYPHSAPPSFHLPPNGTITTRTRNKLKEVLSNAADRYVSVSRPCLEPCLSELISSLEAEAAKNSDLQTPSSSSGLLGLGFEGLGIDSIMGMGPLGMGLGVSSGLAGSSGGDDHSPLDRFDATAAGSSGLQVGSIDGSNPFGLLTQSSAAKRHGADTSGDRGSGGHKRLATATAGLKAAGSSGGAAVDKLSGSDARVDVDRDHSKRSAPATSSGASGREKGMLTTGGGGSAMGGIGRTSSGGSRTRSFSATDTGLTSVSASALLSPTSMSPSSPAVASPSSYYLSSRDESIPAPRTCGVCFGVDGLVEFRSFAGGDSSTQALTASRTYADLRRQLSSRETPSGGMNKNAFVEITKLYFYEEVVDLLPIKMDLSSHGKGAGGQGKGQGSNVLVMRDITALLPISRELAIEYTLTGLSAHDLCAKNCLAAKKVGRKDLVQLWTLVGQLTHASLYQPAEEGANGTMTSPKGTKGAMTADDCPWSYHPFGRSLVASLFRYYQSLGDIQTLAMLACVLSFSPNVVAPSPAPARAMITVQPATSSVASASSSSFFPSIFRRDQVSSSASADEVPVSTGGKPHRDLKRELSLGNEVFGGKLKNLKRERVNSSSFISQPSVQSSTGSLSFSNIDSLTSASALSTSPGDSSPPPPPPPPSASLRHHRISQSGAGLTSASSPTLQSTSLTSSVGELEPLMPNSGVGGGAGDVSTSGGGSSSMLSTASSRLSVGYGRTSSTPNALLSTSPSSPSHMRDAAAREHKRSQSLTSKKAAESRRTEPQVENLNSLLDPSRQPLYEHYKRSYGEVLYRWGLLEKRAEVLKLLQTSTKQQSRMCIGLSLACHNCGQPVTGPSPLCTACRMAAFRCALCHTPVRGLSNFCLVCGHGGHMHHMRQWFEKQAFCPSGCGCPCLTHTPSLIS